jgi:hypothetical protein
MEGKPEVQAAEGVVYWGETAALAPGYRLLSVA